ncbi:hypothetical protein SERLADRAFT_406874 [Serpula lacrymans var. lacrymans S7.9]|uniref:Uncharacterized protein n=1 Tax=Serpula lacrymans var. lacrymans (strain S7.9) TaxID=578457 RepID=F8NN39_SERL9|nr:uncharacterized protein SERLADRAFT_406874 [Serpula lacrymans var. lacrymans S7.9]EGO27960.1 hypothetical protein SERLADRAFT_406874 [Serpula lacrymans var. lacrymans S7.9]
MAKFAGRPGIECKGVQGICQLEILVAAALDEIEHPVSGSKEKTSFQLTKPRHSALIVWPYNVANLVVISRYSNPGAVDKTCHPHFMGSHIFLTRLSFFNSSREHHQLESLEDAQKTSTMEITLSSVPGFNTGGSSVLGFSQFKSVVKLILKNRLADHTTQNKFVSEWNVGVQSKVKTWSSCHGQQVSKVQEVQYEWEAHIVQYIDYVYQQTKLPANRITQCLSCETMRRSFGEGGHQRGLERSMGLNKRSMHLAINYDARNAGPAMKLMVMKMEIIAV